MRSVESFVKSYLESKRSKLVSYSGGIKRTTTASQDETSF